MKTPASVRAFVFGLAVALLFTALPATAQETGRVTGLVTSSSGRVIDGAQVYIEGTRIGALSTNEGRFLLLNVPPGDHVLRVDMIGFRTSEQTITVAAGGTATADFVLSETAVAIDEIVVTGTAAAVRAKEVGNSLEAITSAEFENLPVTNPEDILQGRAPGVTVMNGNGQPGSGGTIRIRGNTTATTAPEPLIYIDGIRVYNLPMGTGGGARIGQSPLQDIDASDIERIEVIKGASATTIYGTEAAGGVVQIFTKKGIAGAPMWTADFGWGANVAPHFGAKDDPTELYVNCNMTDLMFGLDTFNSDDTKKADKVFFEDPTCPSRGSWDKTGFDQRYNLSVRGGFNDITYYVSGAYNQSEGYLPAQGNRDGTFRGNFDFAPSNSLRFSLNTQYTRRETEFVEDGNNSNGFLLKVGRGHQNYLKGGKEDECDGVDPSKICITNTYLFDAENSVRHDHFVSGFTINFEPAVTTHRLAFGWDYTNRNVRSLRPFADLRSPSGFLSDYNTRHTKLSVDYAGSWRTEFGSGTWLSTFSWGGQIFQDQHRFLQIDVDGFAGPGSQTLETGADLTGRTDNRYNTNSAGFFLQEQLGFNDFLFATVGLRVDGNSAFGDDYGLQAYPKASLSYVMSDHAWFPSDWWETLKLRGALGESGKAPNQFAKFRTWTPVAGYVEPGFTPGDPGNENVGPERTSEWEVGFDASWFDGRIGLEYTYWDARTNDALVNVTLPPSEGFTQSLVANVGTIDANGYEVAANFGVIRTDNFDWDAFGTYSYNTSTATDLSGQEIDADIKAAFREGFPAPSNFGRKITNPSEFAEPTTESNQYLGNVFPTDLISLGPTLTFWRNLTADILFEHQGGHTLPNYTGYQNARRGAWRPCFDIQEKIVDFYANGNQSALDGVTALDRGKCAIRGVGPSPNSDYWVEEADFWKLRSLSLAYNIPQRFLGNWFNSATVRLTGRNLVTWVDGFTLTDPEVEDFGDRGETNYDGDGDFGRRDYYTIPNPATWMVSFRLGF
jgi:TonB-linked SusC/RagA family outer membrane protein